jgi:hypothetical protein
MASLVYRTGKIIPVSLSKYKKDYGNGNRVSGVSRGGRSGPTIAAAVLK